MASRKTRRRYRRQVGSEALLRFNPERSSLKGALRDAADERDATISSAASTARGVRSAAKAARPVLKRNYGAAAGSVGQAESDAEKVLATLAPGVHGDLAAGFAARDAAGTKIRLAESLSSAIKDTTSREQEAESGRAWAVNAANAAFGRNVGKVRDRLNQLGREEGAFKQGRLGELLGEDRKTRNSNKQKRLDRRNSRLTSGVDDKGRVLPGGPKDPKVTGDPKVGGGKEATGEQYRGFTSAVEQAKRLAGPLRKDLKRGEVATLLLNGRESREVVDEALYDKLRAQGMQAGEAKRKATRKVPGVKSVKDALAITTALDLVFDGRVSRTTARKIRSQRHIRVKKLGYSVGATPKPKVPDRPKTATGPSGQQRPN